MSQILTIITCARNEEKNISKAIESIQNQSFKNWKYIIVDDQSTDNTRDIISKYAKSDKRIELKIYPDKHEGRHRSGPARNFGLKNVKSKYIAILDADDVCNKYRMEKQINFLDNNSDIGILGTNTLVKTKYINFHLNPPLVDADIKKSLMTTNPIVVSSVMMRLQVFKKIEGFKQTYYGNADAGAWYRAYENKIKFHILNEILTTYNALDYLPLKTIYYSFKLKAEFIIRVNKKFRLLPLPYFFLKAVIRNFKMFMVFSIKSMNEKL